MPRNRTTRAGFTLVELLVVVIIIGILAALLLPVISGAIRRAQEARIGVEIQALDAAINAIHTKYDSYPPDFEEFDRNRIQKVWNWGEYQQTNTGRFIRKNFSKISATDIKFLLQASPAIDNSEALVLWLKGLSTNTKTPFTGPDGPASFAVSGQVDSRFEFDFDPGRLGDRDNDGFQEYYPPYAGDNGVPYAYFNSKNYSVSMPAALYPGAPATNGKVYIHAEHVPTSLWHVALNLSSGGAATYTQVAFPDPDPTSPIGVARPQKSTDAIPPANIHPLDTHRGAALYYVNRDKFQIISGGLDGKYGLSLAVFKSGDPLPAPAGGRVYPANPAPPIDVPIGYGLPEFDNITNYSEGRRLEDLIE